MTILSVQGDDSDPADVAAPCLSAAPGGHSRRSLLAATVQLAAAVGLGGGAAPAPAASALLATATEGAAASPGRRDAGIRRLRTARRYVIDAGWAWVAEGPGQPAALRHEVGIVVEDGLIAAIEAGHRRGRELRVAAQSMLVLPGFISGHTHVAGGTVSRGIFEGRRSYARALELAEQLDDAALDAVTALNLMELLRSGCTTQLDMALSLRQCQSYVRVARRWGVRAYPGAMTPGIGRLFPIWQRKSDDVLRESVAGTLDELRAFAAYATSIDRAEDGRIRPMLTPHAPDTHTPETLQLLRETAQRLGHGIHLHLAQGGGETEAVHRAWGLGSTQWIEQQGLFEQPLFAAHMSSADLAADPAVLVRHGATYATCPSAGGASGFTQPWPEMLAAGVNCNIGIDTHSNDYVENLKLAVLKGEARWSLTRKSSAVAMRRPTVLDALDAATRNAAAGLRRDDLGVLRPGARADWCALDVSGPWVGSGALPPEPLYNLLYASGHVVRHVATDGRLQVHDGALLVDDANTITADAGAAVSALWDQLRAEGFFSASARAR